MKSKIRLFFPIAVVAFFLVAVAPTFADKTTGTIVHISSLKGLIRAIDDLEQSQVKGPAPYVVVAQGPIAKHFSRFKSVGGPKEQVRNLSGQGVSFEICAGAVLAGDLTEKDLRLEVRHLEQGAPKRIKELKSSGYLHLRY
jgi:intracellular sulfur oxidation DsrE/DsrF family protein